MPADEVEHPRGRAEGRLAGEIRDAHLREPRLHTCDDGIDAAIEARVAASKASLHPKQVLRRLCVRRNEATVREEFRDLVVRRERSAEVQRDRATMIGAGRVREHATMILRVVEDDHPVGSNLKVERDLDVLNEQRPRTNERVQANPREGESETTR